MIISLSREIALLLSTHVQLQFTLLKSISMLNCELFPEHVCHKLELSKKNGFIYLDSVVKKIS